MLYKAAVRHCIDANERDLGTIERKRAEFKAQAAALVEWANKNHFIDPKCVASFLGSVDDGLSDLFYEVTNTMEEDIATDRHLIGAEG